MHETHEEEHHCDNGTWDAAVDESREFLGRGVWFHWKRCRRPHVSSRPAKSKESWEGALVALRRHNLDPHEVRWLETLCGHYEPSISFQTRPACLQMLFVFHAMPDDRGKTERIFEYKTHLVRFPPYRLRKGAWVKKSLILLSILEPEAPANSYATIGFPPCFQFDTAKGGTPDRFAS